MQTRFLLGPSGSGKTFRCIAEVSVALRESPSGSPLIFLCPKQASFQVERQLLADPKLGGYTRLQIVSFEKLGKRLLQALTLHPPRLLNEEGRLMVLRALLSKKRDQLSLFRATARLRGFAQQLSVVLRELQRAQMSPEELLNLAARVGNRNQLDLKLRDLAAMLSDYLAWLDEHKLVDQDQVLSLAAEALCRTNPAGGWPDSTAGAAWPKARAVLWMDGFSELAPQEMDFLLAVLPFCERATLAFNLDRESLGPISWLSPWSIVGQTYQRLQERLGGRTDLNVLTDWLEPLGPMTRFAHNPVLRHLERNWSTSRPFDSAQASNRATAVGNLSGALEQSLRVVVCPTPEEEAAAAAREITQFVRSGGNFREAAVIVRKLEDYADTVQRVFRAFQIPFFLDQRQPVGHHPLVELTRSSLRTVAGGWETEDWFSALKTGLVDDREADLDRLENEALARGWNGEAWLQPLKISDNPELAAWLEPVRQKLVVPFQQLAMRLGNRPSGRHLAAALESFWSELAVENTLQSWGNLRSGGRSESSRAVHLTLWRQMHDWLENLALAFGDQTLPLREWLPIIDAGLANQTVGVIPPMLDQVLVGAIDRSRNPDLKLVILLGLNETVFPARPEEPGLLTNADREHLLNLGINLSGTNRRQLAQERYLGYIACTRPTERLVVTYCLRDEQDRTLNRSAFVDQLCRLFPALKVETALSSVPWNDCEHISELVAATFEGDERSGVSFLPKELQVLPRISRLQHEREVFRSATLDQRLAPRLAEYLHGMTLETSVSRLEEYAACPFRFAVTVGFRAEERKVFRLDSRHQGSFQHEVLARFHQELQAEGKQWRDLDPKEARKRIQTVAEKVMPEYEQGLLQSTEQSRFMARSMVLSLQEFISTAVYWMGQYEFDPHSVELAFGIEEKPLPAWEIDLGKNHRLSFRGKIDRVDLWRHPDKGDALCVVIDYKSSLRKLDPVLITNGIQLQLLGYLNVLRALEQPEKVFGVRKLIPAGVFFVNLRGRYPSARSRQEVWETFKQTRVQAYQHTGRFDVSALSRLDNRVNAMAGDQFNYRRCHGGKMHQACREPLTPEHFGELLNLVEAHLKRMGQEIYEGNVKVSPYRKGNTTPCQRCGYKAVCRIDPWTQEYRTLRAAPAATV